VLRPDPSAVLVEEAFCKLAEADPALRAVRSENSFFQQPGAEFVSSAFGALSGGVVCLLFGKPVIVIFASFYEVIRFASHFIDNFVTISSANAELDYP
jgi:hypothetical protein